MRARTSLAVVSSKAAGPREAAITEAAQWVRQRARDSAPAGEVTLRAQHFLLGGQLVAFVDVDGTQETNLAEVAATLQAIGAVAR